MTDKYDALIKRLKADVEIFNDGYPPVTLASPPEIQLEAAAAIERLQARCDLMTGCEKALHDYVLLAQKHNAEIAKLREALEEIKLGQGDYHPDRFEHCKNTIINLKAIARAALGDNET